MASSGDDLLIRRRRGTLSGADASELRRALRDDPELALSLRAGEAFDRLDTTLPGDPQLLAEIVRGSVRAPPPWARLRWLVAVPLLATAAAAASWGAERWLAGPPEPSAAPDAARATGAAPEQPARDTPPPTPAEPEVEAPVDTEAPAVEAPVVEAPAVEANDSDRRSLEQPARRAAVDDGEAGARARARRPASPHPAPRRAPPVRSSAEPVERATREPDGVAATPRAPAQPPRPSAAEPAASTHAAKAGPVGSESDARPLSPRELLERANQARAHDWLAAEALYTFLIDSYPGSSQAAVAEMALGKHALGEGRADDALRWFRRHQQRASSALRIEALWGECQALERLGRTTEHRACLERLIEDHPTTTYAAVARRRLLE